MNTDNNPRPAARECFKRLTHREKGAVLDSFYALLACMLASKAGAVQPPELPADVAPVDAFDAGDGAALADAVDAWLQNEVMP